VLGSLKRTHHHYKLRCLETPPKTPQRTGTGLSTGSKSI